METLGPSPPDAEIHLLTEWGDPSDRPRGRRAAALSILFHVVVIGTVALAPAALWEPPRLADAPIVTPLVEPFTALTQKAPNKGKVNKDFDVAAVQPRPRIQISPGAVQPRTFNPSPPPPAPAPKPVALPEPPRVEEHVVKPDLPQIAQALPPRIQPVEQPKLVLEAPTDPPQIDPGQGRPLPKATAAEAIRGAMGGGAAGRPDRKSTRLNPSHPNTTYAVFCLKK